jgi:hypothetical protein
MNESTVTRLKIIVERAVRPVCSSAACKENDPKIGARKGREIAWTALKKSGQKGYDVQVIPGADHSFEVQTPGAPSPDRLAPPTVFPGVPRGSFVMAGRKNWQAAASKGLGRQTLEGFPLAPIAMLSSRSNANHFASLARRSL